jgi:hypothetical protein
MSNTITTATQYANDVPRTFRVTFPMARPSDGKVVNLPVIVIATRATANDKAAAILRSRLSLPTSYTLLGRVQLLRGPVGAEGIATNDSVVPPLNKRKVRS